VWPVAKARQFLSQTTVDYVVVQIEQLFEELLYLLPRAAIIARIKDKPDDLDLRAALDLKESDSAPVVDPTTPAADIAQPAVVRDLDGSILGFVMPHSTMRALS
jgi:hypothetical protein